MPKMTYDIGYYGKVTIGGLDLLTTGGSVNVQYSPIFTTGIWGANWKYATDKIAYSPNYISLTCNANYQLTSSITDTISSFAFSSRSSAYSCSILPNGIAGYSGKMYCTGCGFSTSQDSLVSGELSFKTGQVNGKYITTSSATSTTNSIYQGSFIGTAYQSVYPYWGSGIFTGTDPGRVSPSKTTTTTQITDILSWNVSYSSDLILTACCNYNTSGSILEADYCALGMMNAQGSFIRLGVGDGLTTNNFFEPNKIQNATTIHIKMSDVNHLSTHIIKFGAIVWTNFGTDIQTGTSLIQTTFNFEGLGNSSSAPMDFY